MFIGRKKELTFLNNAYNRKGFDFIPIYGRRRVGKTELIHRFVEGKRHIVYSAIEQSATLSLNQFSEMICDALKMPYKITFTDWDQLISFMGTQLTDEKLIVVIDEYPYLAKQSPELSSILQKHMDHTFKDANIMIILCGSSMSFMEEQVLGYQSPLYGRRTGQIKLLPLNYRESGAFLAEGSDAERFLLYSVCGGIPQYLKSVVSYGSVEEGIINCFFETTGHLYEEPYNLLKQELREPANYFSVIAAIASGKNRSNEIAGTAGIENTSVSKYLKSLIDLGIVERRTPAGSKAGKRSLYSVCDNCFRFWFKFVFTEKTAIEFGKGEVIWQQIKQEALPTYQGLVFEAVASEFLMMDQVFEAVIPREVNSWWGTNAVLKKEEELDLVADCRNGKYIVGECKWRNEVTKVKVLSELRRKTALLGFVSEAYYCLFSKSGYSQELLETSATDSRLALISLSDLYKEVNPSAAQS